MFKTNPGKQQLLGSKDRKQNREEESKDLNRKLTLKLEFVYNLPLSKNHGERPTDQHS